MKIQSYAILLCVIVFIISFTSCSSLKDTPGEIQKEEIAGLNNEDEKSFNTAVDLYNAGNFIQAKEILIELRNKNKKYAPVYYYLGLIAYDEQQYDLSETNHKTAIELDPNYAEPYFELSTIKINERNADEAKMYVEKAIELNPHMGIAYLNLSSVYTLLGDNEKSIEYVYKAAEIDPIIVSDHAWIFYEQYGNANAALYYFQILYDLYPKDSLILYNIGTLYRMINENDTAVRFLEIAFENARIDDAMFCLYYSSYFRLLLDLDMTERLINSIFNKTSEKCPDSPYFFISLAYYKMGNLAEFEKNVKTYFELSGEAPPESLEEWAADMIIPKRDDNTIYSTRPEV